MGYQSANEQDSGRGDSGEPDSRLPGEGTSVISTALPSAPVRLASIDAYRGFVMLLMMAEVLSFGSMAKQFPESEVWAFLRLQQTHASWSGCNLHDLIQPSFSFLVGTSLAFSILNRRRKGQSLLRMTLHAAWRALILIALGVFLRSVGAPQTRFTFEDTLSQIGMGYFFLFLLALASPRWWWAAFVLIVVGYFAAFAAYPLPGPDFNYKQLGLKPPLLYSGFEAHWNINTNFAWAFDRWFLNLFPRKEPFTANRGGYSTLSFIPTLATMILGLIAGGWLRSDRRTWIKLLYLTVAGLVFLGIGWAADFYGICPSVKRIWTSSWVLYSGGWCFLMLAGFYLALDVPGWYFWAFPLIVIGANPIVAYCMNDLWGAFIISSFKTHLGQDIFKIWGDPYQRLVQGIFVLVTMWLILLWMYRRKIFVRI